MPLRVVLLNGHYRSYYTVPSRDNAAPLASAPLVITAQNSGKAIISGSDVQTDWKGPDEYGVYRMAWAENWGKIAHVEPESHAWALKPIFLRREMVFVGGARMKQVQDDATALQPVAPQTLQPGEFSVDESGDQILLKATSGHRHSHCDGRSSQTRRPTRQ
jgi:hypothetical protein